MTGASLGFGKTLLIAPYNILLMSVLTSMYNARAYTRRGRRREEIFFNEEELHDMREDNKKKEEHIYPPIMSPGQFNQAVIPISPV